MSCCMVPLCRNCRKKRNRFQGRHIFHRQDFHSYLTCYVTHVVIIVQKFYVVLVIFQCTVFMKLCAAVVCTPNCPVEIQGKCSCTYKIYCRFQRWITIFIGLLLFHDWFVHLMGLNYYAMECNGLQSS